MCTSFSHKLQIDSHSWEKKFKYLISNNLNCNDFRFYLLPLYQEISSLRPPKRDRDLAKDQQTLQEPYKSKEVRQLWIRLQLNQK